MVFILPLSLFRRLLQRVKKMHSEIRRNKAEKLRGKQRNPTANTPFWSSSAPDDVSHLQAWLERTGLQEREGEKENGCVASQEPAHCRVKRGGRGCGCRQTFLYLCH